MSHGDLVLISTVTTADNSVELSYSLNHVCGFTVVVNHVSGLWPAL